MNINPAITLEEHERHMSDGRWHDDCLRCLERRTAAATSQTKHDRLAELEARDRQWVEAVEGLAKKWGEKVERWRREGNRGLMAVNPAYLDQLEDDLEELRALVERMKGGGE